MWNGPLGERRMTVFGASTGMRSAPRELGGTSSARHRPAGSTERELRIDGISC
jgi:hypothetical protein